MARNITTKTTFDRLAGLLNENFAKKTDLTTISTAATSAFKAGKVEGNTVKLFTTTETTGAAAFSFDFPTEYFLDQTKSQFVQSFAFSTETYPGATDPSLDGKPVMVLAVKAEGGSSVTYSFVDLTYLLNTYVAKTDGKDASTAVTIDGYTIEVKVNISSEEGNQLQLKADGLFVGKQTTDVSGKADKDTDAVEGNLAMFDANGNPVDGGKAVTGLLMDSDISDYTEDELRTLLGIATE